MDALTTPYEAIGGAPVVAAIVDRFYDLMDEDPAYADVRRLHAKQLGPIKEGLAQFLNGWLGGPRDWFDKGLCMRSMHVPMAISAEAARQWAEAMARAIDAEPGVDESLKVAMAQRLTQIALSMVNRPVPGGKADSGAADALAGAAPAA